MSWSLILLGIVSMPQSDKVLQTWRSSAPREYANPHDLLILAELQPICAIDQRQLKDVRA